MQFVSYKMLLLLLAGKSRCQIRLKVLFFFSFKSQNCNLNILKIGCRLLPSCKQTHNGHIAATGLDKRINLRSKWSLYNQGSEGIQNSNHLKSKMWHLSVPKTLQRLMTNLKKKKKTSTYMDVLPVCVDWGGLTH